MPPPPDNPADPANPADPVNPANPVDPADPVNPVNPADPANPVNPAAPADPVNPENPAAPISSIRFSENNYSAREHQGGAQITVLREGGTQNAATVQYISTDITAVSGTDYTSVSNTLSFAPGVTNATFSVPLIGNSRSNDTKFVRLELKNPTDAVLGQPSDAVLAILQETTFKHYLKEVLSPRVLSHLLLITLLLLFTYAGFHWSKWQAEKISNDWVQSLRGGRAVTEDAPEPEIKLAFDEKVSASPQQQARLQEQLRESIDRTKHHLAVMRFFYTRYYVAIILFSMTGALAAVSLVLISKRGWEDSNEYVITVFFLMTALTICFGSFPGLFQQDKNIADNKALYLKYSALTNEIISYAVTGEATQDPAVAGPKQLLQKTETTEGQQKQGENSNTQPQDKQAQDQQQKGASKEESRTGIPVSSAEFIHYVDQQLALGTIAVGFDYNQKPEFTDAFNKAISGR